MEQRKKTYYYCSVSGCLNSTLNCDFTFFSLPVVSERQTKWLKLMHQEDSIDSICTSARVCEAHFSSDSIIISTKRKLLKKNSVPKLLLPLPEHFANKGIQTIIETTNAYSQCNYYFRTNAQVQTPLYLSNDTPQIRKLLREIQICRKRINISRNKQSETKMLHKLCDKILTKNLASIVKQQAKLKSHSPGNRFSLDYKIFCLNLYHLSPAAYNLLKNTLCLPSTPILKKMYMTITTKIDNPFMDVLKTKVQNMSDVDRNCTLVVDVMSLKANFFYNIREDRIYGFHEVDGVQSPEPATYALVAMIHGLFKNYKQPVGYALLAECKNYQSISEWIDKLILKLFSIGLSVRSLVSDIGYDILNSAGNRSVSAERPFIFVGERKIYYTFDPSHLIKLVRNNLMTFEFHFENSVAKWDHIIQFYEMDKLKRLRLAPKLTDSHIKPTNFERMNIKYAVQVLNASVAAGLSTYRDFGVIENSAEGTIKLISLMTDLLDFFNTASCCGSTKYQNAFCGEENQTSFVNNMLDFFALLKIINPNNGENVTSEIQFIKGFQITLKSLLLLFEDFRIEGYSHILTRRLNQDCLKTFFGQIRTKNGNSMEVTTWQLVSDFRKHFFINVLKSPKGVNCAEDLAKTLLDGEQFFASPPKHEQDPETTLTMLYNQEHSANFNTIPSISLTDYNTLDVPKKNALVYVSGYLLRKCVDHHKECNLLMAYTKGEDNSPNFSQDTRFTRYKDYCTDDTKNLLTIPQDSFVEFVELMEERYCTFFKINYINCQILKSLLLEIQTLTFPMPCQCFPVAYCKSLFIRMRIHYTVKCNNRAFRQCRNRKKFFSVTNL